MTDGKGQQNMTAQTETTVKAIPGIHHMTVLASDPQRNVDFYTDVLGLRLIKRTVNFDDPGTYHLYYGDETGTPGTILTFFPFPHAAQGKRGSGEIQAIAFSICDDSLGYWAQRLASKGIPFDGPGERFGSQVITFLDPDGLKLELVVQHDPLVTRPWTQSSVPAEHRIRGFAGVTMGYADDQAAKTFLTEVMQFREEAAAGPRTRFTVGVGREQAFVDTIILPDATRARQSAGSVHHIAWRVSDDDMQNDWREHLLRKGSFPTEMRDRNYFHSIYFREPGGVLFEIATDTPGFLIDEDVATLGSEVRLPPWFEEHRERIERTLIPLEVGRSATTAQA